ncbi:hypothetical protein ACFVGN_05810 [Streptomyces sp. NPDC057757]|uniref:hypothetical protein n=1 Tax=Streptomyces sp. NPDC057757 TaxID=3346241 RepID=UPI0036AE7ACE
MTVLEYAWTIATPWSLGSPGPSPRQEFEGIAAADIGARFSVPGIEWMEFRITRSSGSGGRPPVE